MKSDTSPASCFVRCLSWTRHTRRLYRFSVVIVCHSHSGAARTEAKARVTLSNNDDLQKWFTLNCKEENNVQTLKTYISLEPKIPEDFYAASAFVFIQEMKKRLPKQRMIEKRVLGCGVTDLSTIRYSRSCLLFATFVTDAISYKGIRSRRLILATRYKFPIASITHLRHFIEAIYYTNLYFFTQQFPSLITSSTKFFISQLAGSGSSSPKSLARASQSVARPMSLSDRPLGTCVVQRMNVVL